jgi:outer membrane autotransporter protein
VTQSFAGTVGTSFTVEGARLPGDSAVIGAGVSATIFPGGSAYIHYDGDLAGKGSTQAFTAGFRFGW